MNKDELAAIEARADAGCDGHGRADLRIADLPDILYCPCTDQTAVDVRVLLSELRRLRRILSGAARDEHSIECWGPFGPSEDCDCPQRMVRAALGET